jgi:two-component system response regulator MprA
MAGPAEEDERALILVVERDKHIRALEHYFLEDAGYSVEFAEDGVHALARVKQIAPRILISEILVPGMDGLSVCRAIKADPETAHIVVLIFSILAAEERALEAGADGFLLKPLDETRFVTSVERLLKHGPEKTSQ